MPVAASSSPRTSASISDTTPHPLSSSQERRLTSYLDEKLLEVQGEYKKRNYETSTLRTLSTYIQAVRPLLALILMIPPVHSSIHLRASLLLRLTGEFLDCTPGYAPDLAELLELLDVLNELDRGWLAVLRGQTWNPKTREGADLILPPNTGVQVTPISQTDRARLRSIFIVGTDKLEEWLEDVLPTEENSEVPQVLEAITLRQKFNDLFLMSLTEMGELHGTV